MTEGTAPDVLLEWTHSMKLLRNVRLVRSMALAFGLPSVLIGLLVTATSGNVTALIVMSCIGAFLLGLALLIMAAIGQSTVHFTLTTEGVVHEAAGRSRTVGAVATAGGLVAGRPGAAVGAAMEQHRVIRWKEVGRVRIDERRREILVRPVSLIKPILLHCDPELFPRVREIVERQAPAKA